MVAANPRLDMEFVPRRRVTPKTPPVPLADILLRLRGERGFLQRQISERSGLEQSYYSALETGSIQRPGKAKLEALDRAFDLEPGSLEYWLENGPPWSMRPPTPIHDDVEILPLSESGDIVALFKRVPSSRRGQAREIIRRQAIEVLRVLADETERYSP